MESPPTCPGMDGNLASDADLLKRLAASGDADALAELFSRHVDAAYRLACRHALNSADAEDAVQTAFLNALKHAQGYRKEASVKAWLLGFVVNACRHIQREEARRKRRELEAARGADEVAHEAPGIEQGETARLALEAARRLADPYRLPVWLYYYEGLSSAEVAAALGLSEGTVRSQLARGLEALRGMLGARAALLTGLEAGGLAALAIAESAPAPLKAACAKLSLASAPGAAAAHGASAATAAYAKLLLPGMALLLALAALPFLPRDAAPTAMPAPAAPVAEEQPPPPPAPVAPAAPKEAPVFHPLWEQALGGADLVGRDMESVVAGRTLYLGGLSILAFDLDSGRRRWAPGQDPNGFACVLPTPAGLIVADNVGYIEPLGGVTGRIVADNRIHLYKPPARSPAWSFPTAATVYHLIHEGEVAVAADRGGTVYGIDVKNGTKAWSLALPGVQAGKADEVATVRPEALLKAEGRALVLYARVLERTMEKKDVPPGQPSSWVAGMPENMARVTVKRELRVACLQLAREAGAPAPGTLLWSAAREDPDSTPGPALSLEGEGRARLFTGKESVTFRIADGNVIREKAAGETLSYFHYLGANHALRQQGKRLSCTALSDLSAAWTAEDEDEEFKLEACASIGAYALTCSSKVEWAGDLGRVTDARLRLRELAGGKLVRSHLLPGAGDLSFHVAGDTLVCIGEQKAFAFKLGAAGEPPPAPQAEHEGEGF
ncbi:MAG: sigma-70 family RNA polymerase sigma factor [Planctomycetota bacterium]|nr:sigma-70 family RNA polymerase sigma factor [Planctomycetota bacterium]